MRGGNDVALSTPYLFVALYPMPRYKEVHPFRPSHIPLRSLVLVVGQYQERSSLSAMIQARLYSLAMLLIENNVDKAINIDNRVNFIYRFASREDGKLI